ncbi:MAG: flagellar assembly protein FliH [bacterium]|nr:flagellar assembly protein FliH [bacterium]
MFKGSLLKYVKLLDTPFLVGMQDGNGKGPVEEEEELPPEKEEVVSLAEEDLLSKREDLKREIELLENRLKELSVEARSLVEKSKGEADNIKRTAEEEAKRLSQRILEEARREAERLKEEASKSGYKEGYEKGFSEGYSAGLKEGKAQYEEQINLLKGVLEEIKKAKEKLIEEIEPEIVEIIKIVLRKIILKEAEIDRDLVLRVIKAAIKRLEERGRIVVRVNPDDLPKVVERREEFFKDIEGLKELEIVEDPRVDRGGCIVEGDLGVVDARIRAQIEEFERFLDRLLKEGREEEGLA